MCGNNFIDFVTSREGSVDWNVSRFDLHIVIMVTSREGSVDWNHISVRMGKKEKRHFPWGKCGLKFKDKAPYDAWERSLPVREVWIEIGYDSHSGGFWPSLPVREVWIEIFWFWRVDRGAGVTSREGSVDWNSFNFCFLYVTYRHFPWGKCGLKYCCLVLFYILSRHFPWGKCGLKYIGSMPVVIFLFVTSREGSVDWNGKNTGLKWKKKSHFPWGKCGLKF